MGPYTAYSNNWREGTFRPSRAKARVNHRVDASIRILSVPHSIGEARPIRAKPRWTSVQTRVTALRSGLFERLLAHTLINRTDEAGMNSHRTAVRRPAFRSTWMRRAGSGFAPRKKGTKRKKRHDRAMAIPLRAEPASRDRLVLNYRCALPGSGCCDTPSALQPSSQRPSVVRNVVCCVSHAAGRPSCAMCIVIESR
ncbi:hypothetical protein OKW40_006893 [Paraburkholderia sp. RAU6.4a]